MLLIMQEALLSEGDCFLNGYLNKVLIGRTLLVQTNFLKNDEYFLRKLLITLTDSTITSSL